MHSIRKNISEVSQYNIKTGSACIFKGNYFLSIGNRVLKTMITNDGYGDSVSTEYLTEKQVYGKRAKMTIFRVCSCIFFGSDECLYGCY